MFGVYTRVFGPWLVVAAGLIAIPHQAGAAVVFQSVPDLNDGLSLAWCSSCAGQFRIFDQFSLGSTQQITGLTVSVYDFATYWPTDMDFSIWTVSGNLPGVQIFSQVLDDASFSTLFLSGPLRVVHTDTVSGLSLGAGTYYASFQAFNLGIWGYNGGGGNLYQQENQHHVGTSAGFILHTNAAVPEPASLLMLSLGLAGVGLLKRWRG